MNYPAGGYRWAPHISTGRNPRSPRPRTLAVGLWAGLLLVLISVVCGAQEDVVQNGPSEGLGLEAVEQSLRLVRAKIAEEGETEGERVEGGAVPEGLLEILLARESVLTQIVEHLKSGETQSTAWNLVLEPEIMSVTEGERISFSSIDRVSELIEEHRFRMDQLKDKIADGEIALEAAKKRVRDLEALNRRFTDRSGPITGSETERFTAPAALELAQDRQDLVIVRRRSDKRALAAMQEDLDLHQQRFAEFKKRLEPKAEDLEGIFRSLETRETEVSEILEGARRDVERAALAVARTDRLPAGKENDDRLHEARTRASLANRRISVLAGIRERVSRTRIAWERRFMIHTGKASGKDVKDWKKEYRLEKVELDTYIGRTGRRAAIRGSNRIMPSVGDNGANLRLSALGQEMIGLDLEEIADVQAYSALIDRILYEIGDRAETWSMQQRWHEFRIGIEEVWHFEILVVDDKAVTIGKIIIVFLILGGGIPVSKRILGIIGRRIGPRLGLAPGAASAIQSLVFYCVTVVIVLFSLWISGIPLTIFTLVGGALAIGIGFGSQNVLNNFISGVILLVERPIKVGDLVEVEGTFGEIEWMGARSTRVKTFDNIHIIVPNSTFLENNVINWTLTDHLVRVMLEVGVAYGSPTRLTEELIHRAIDEHPKARKKPEPMVFFEEFGESALLFRARIWINMWRPQDRSLTLSDLRHRIDELFKEQGIVIAFPQRDVHLHSAGPIEVRVLGADDG